MISKLEKRNLILKVKFEIVDEEGLKRKLSNLRQWYNDHWFVDKETLVKQAKSYVYDHLNIILVDENENL